MSPWSRQNPEMQNTMDSRVQKTKIAGLRFKGAAFKFRPVRTAAILPAVIKDIIVASFTALITL